jgi:hypothetical protein
LQKQVQKQIEHLVKGKQEYPDYYGNHNNQNGEPCSLLPCRPGDPFQLTDNFAEELEGREASTPLTGGPAQKSATGHGYLTSRCGRLPRQRGQYFVNSILSGSLCRFLLVV